MIVSVMAGPVAGSRAEAEYDDFFMTNSTWIVGWVATLTGNIRDAEDAVQEAFSRAYRDWAKVGRLTRPELWVLKTARNLAISNWRKNRRTQPLKDARYAAAEDLIEREWLRSAMTGLSPHQRASFVLHHAQGVPIAEVAESLHTTETTIRTHLMRARLKLKRALGGEIER